MAISIALDFLLEIEGKILFIKITYTSDTGLERIEIEVTGKPPHQGLALIVSEVSMKAAKGEKQSVSYQLCSL